MSFIAVKNHTLSKLLACEDTDGDGRITADDDGNKGTYRLANLVQELVLGHDTAGPTFTVDGALLVEDPVTRICRRIDDMFWANLTRRLDKSLIAAAAPDPKDWTTDARPRIYIPCNLPEQYEYYSKVAQLRPELNLEVLYLPSEPITASDVKAMNNKPGILALGMRSHEGVLRGLEFVVPGGRFNELYGWDSYFCALGLLETGRSRLVMDIVLNLCFEIQHYGRILNANRSYYLGRSQPPLLTDLIRRTYECIKHEAGSRDFVHESTLAAIKEYFHVWLCEPRLDTKTGLSRYRPTGDGIPPEVESTQFDHIFSGRARAHGMTTLDFANAYDSGAIKDAELDSYFLHDRAVRESGHDTQYRLEGVAGDLATIDLNALLYKYETDIAWIIKNVFNDQLEVPSDCTPTGSGVALIQTSAEWLDRALKRKASVDKYLWSPGKGMFYDYNTVTETQSPHESVTCLWALWSGLASADQAARLVAAALPKFEMPGGLVATTEASIGPQGSGHPSRQWDFPSGWAPHQVMAWDGLTRYGYHKEAARLAYRWLHMITRVTVDYHGAITEKYNVVRAVRQHEVHAEYGNQGTAFRGIAREGFGWTNASYTYGLKVISEHQKRALRLLIPYEATAKSGR
ncbi:alpha,alpha-trehalase nth1 [Teratosphaeriaceae sp. CCFEE 6253]|nr:alpha,alpha-trehalase nth1 [Teratosphaeriaceae sp. CCFEE 6253]